GENFYDGVGWQGLSLPILPNPIGPRRRSHLQGTPLFPLSSGKAYLFNHGTNISVGDEEERVLFSGMHTVADIFCCCCGQNVGWKYVVAQEKTQKYKEGKFVLERGRIADGTDLEFYVDTRPSGSDADDS
ncbi:unnamed protein product, partial [Musa acuminata var. zebrina]